LSLFVTNVNDILKDFHKILDRLDAHSEAKAEEIAECDERILEYKNKLLTAATEMDRAKAVATKIRELVIA